MSHAAGSSVDALPFLQAPVDTLREGAGVNLKHAGVDTHEVQALERRGAQMAARERQSSLRALYGSALPAKAALDAQILGRFQRLPGGATPSAMLGMQAVSGELDDCGLAEHFGGDFAVKEMGSGDLHGQMETQLRMRKDGRPL